MLIFPVMFNQNIQAEELDINVLSPYAYLYDLENGQVLYDKNGEEKIYPASMTKLMTALIAIEHLDLDQKILITSEMYAPFAGINASIALAFVTTLSSILLIVALVLSLTVRFKAVGVFCATSLPLTSVI